MNFIEYFAYSADFLHHPSRAGLFPVQGIIERFAQGAVVVVVAIFPEHGAEQPLLEDETGLPGDGFGIVVAEEHGPGFVGKVRDLRGVVPVVDVLAGVGAAGRGQDGCHFAELDVFRIRVGSMAVERDAEHQAVERDAGLAVLLDGFLAGSAPGKRTVVKRRVVVRRLAHVVGHDIDVVEIFHGPGPVDVTGAGRGGEGDDLRVAEGLPEFLQHEVEIGRIVLALAVGGRSSAGVLPVDVDAVEAIGVDMGLAGLAEFRALPGIAGHHGEAVSLFAPAADHQEDLQRRAFLLERQHFLQQVGAGDDDAAVAGRGILEAPVGVVDMGHMARLEARGGGVFGQVGDDHGPLAEEFVAAMVLGRSRGVDPVGDVAEGQQTAAGNGNRFRRADDGGRVRTLFQREGEATAEVRAGREADIVERRSVGGDGAGNAGQRTGSAGVGSIVPVEPRRTVILQHEIALEVAVPHGFTGIAPEGVAVVIAADAEGYEAAEVIEDELVAIVVRRHERMVRIVESGVIIEIAVHHGVGGIGRKDRADIPAVGPVVRGNALHADGRLLPVGGNVLRGQGNGFAVPAMDKDAIPHLPQRLAIFRDGDFRLGCEGTGKRAGHSGRAPLLCAHGALSALLRTGAQSDHRGKHGKDGIFHGSTLRIVAFRIGAYNFTLFFPKFQIKRSPPSHRNPLRLHTTAAH